MKQFKDIQDRFKSSKALRNEFANFDYRNVELMLFDLKPILREHGCTITFTDIIETHGSHNYVKAMVTISNEEGESVSASAYAREDDSRTGMSAPQLTGCASTYARKYALCGLLAVDSGGDPDSMDNRSMGAVQTQHLQQEEPMIPVQSAINSSNRYEHKDNTMEDVDAFISRTSDSADEKLNEVLKAFRTECLNRSEWLKKWGCNKAWSFFYGDYKEGKFKVVQVTPPGVNCRKIWTVQRTKQYGPVQK